MISFMGPEAAKRTVESLKKAATTGFRKGSQKRSTRLRVQGLGFRDQGLKFREGLLLMIFTLRITLRALNYENYGKIP